MSGLRGRAATEFGSGKARESGAQNFRGSATALFLFYTRIPKIR